MAKTIKFSISMPAPEFKALEAGRRKVGRTRSQFVREAVLRTPDERTPGQGALSIKEDRGAYGSPHPTDLTDMAELRQRALAAAGRFESGVPDISMEHDRYLTDPEAGDKNGPPGRAGKGGETR